MSLSIPKLEIREAGTIKEIRKGIVRIHGLPSCIYGQMLQLNSGLKGMVIGFDEKEVTAFVFGEEKQVHLGAPVYAMDHLMQIPVSEQFIGRAFSGIGEPVDSLGPIVPEDHYPVFREAPGILERDEVARPFVTGIKMIDAMIPVGRGQRELIIGDRVTGKSTIGVDAILNQHDQDVVCIYCFVGGNAGSLNGIIERLNSKGAFRYSIVVAAPSVCPPAEQYVAPYTAAAIGEYFMHKGKDVFVVFDDLTKHAWVYRQLSLLLDRSPGREAYPGDIFYIHSQLMERAAQMSAQNGGGSMTFFPITETLQGDVTGYVQSNLVSITDGQIYMSSDLFQSGFKPAIDLTLSVSRVGSKAQHPPMRKVSGMLRMEYARYKELLRLTRLRSRLSGDVVKQVTHGNVLSELLKQGPQSPISWQEMTVLFYLLNEGLLDKLLGKELVRFKTDFFIYFKQKRKDLVDGLIGAKELSDEWKEIVKSEFKSFMKIEDENEEESSS